MSEIPCKSRGAVLHTQRMVFERVTAADADDLTELDSDPEVMQYINGGVPVPREKIVDDVIPRWLAMYEAQEGLGFFIVRDTASREFFGWFHLRIGHHWKDELEIGYRLKRAVWGRGLATEGTKALMRVAFETLRRPKVMATTMLPNIASRRVMEKSGMTFECEFFEDRWPGEDKKAVKYAVFNPLNSGSTL